MNSKRCTSLPESAVESLPTSFSGTSQLSLLSGTNTPVQSSESESQTDGLTECQCGKAMSKCLIHPNTKDEWIAFMQDSLARTLARPDIKLALAKIRGLDFTERFYALPMRFDLHTCSWRMSQQSLLDATVNGSELSLATLPREATMLSGFVYPLPKLAQYTKETDGGCLPTPCASTGGAGKNPNNPRGVHQGNPLATYVAMFPTPCAWDNRNRGNLSNPSVQRRKKMGKQIMLSQGGGALNPTWVEWLMGFPIEHTALKD